MLLFINPELKAMIAGGVIGFLCSLATTCCLKLLDDRRHSKSIQIIISGEIHAIKEKITRYFNDLIDTKQITASEPLLDSIASELGYLCPEQIKVYRDIVTLDQEIKIEPSKPKAKRIIDNCKEALKLFPL